MKKLLYLLRRKLRRIRAKAIYFYRYGIHYNEGKEGIHIYWRPVNGTFIFSFMWFKEFRIRIIYSGDRWKACISRKGFQEAILKPLADSFLKLAETFTSAAKEFQKGGKVFEENQKLLMIFTSVDSRAIPREFKFPPPMS